MYDEANILSSNELQYDKDVVIANDGEKQDLASPEARQELWKLFEGQADEVKDLRRDWAPGNLDYDDDYNQVNQVYNNRGVTGFENDARAKRFFVEMEYWIEEVIGKSQLIKQEVGAYKGTPKKWQILSDTCFDREQVEKLQQYADAPMPEQLESWAEGSNKPIKAPFNNQTFATWRDEP